MKIAVRGGHAKSCPGARGIMDELVEDRKVKDAVIKYLKQLGHDVLDCSTPSDAKFSSPQDLSYGVNKANKWGANLFVSIHFNKAYDRYEGAIGTEVCVYRKTDTSKRVVDSLAKLGFKNRGEKIRDGLYELKHTNMPSMIVEVCFCEATKDVELYRKLGSDKIGKTIAEAVANKKVPSSKPSKPSPPKPSPSKPNSKETWYRVVVGSYLSRKDAESQQKKLKSKGIDSFLAAFKKDGKDYLRVVAGSYKSKNEAIEQQNVLKKKGFDSFLVAFEK